MVAQVVLQVRRDDVTVLELREAELAPLQAGSVRLRVDAFAVTANNVTYAVMGDAFGYWNFFPADSGWGIVPVWGHATVEASDHSGIVVGERVYGYLPMATHLDVEPGAVSDAMFVDEAPHRRPMSAFYNQYRRLSADAAHDSGRESRRMIFQPLFTTSFLIEDMFRTGNWFGTDALIVTSASAKTALALAHVTREKSPAVRRIGLTSSGNEAFVRATDLYDEVLTYDRVAELAGRAAVLVDIAGNATVLRAVHEALVDDLRYSCTVGATHVGERGRGRGSALPGPEPVLFFAPDHARAAMTAMGADAYDATIARSWNTFMTTVDGALVIEERRGLTAAADAFRQIVGGSASPGVGVVITP